MTEANSAGPGDLLSREWIVTNGLGGYASSTLCGANTRRYHGILIASLNPPTERVVFVSKIEERILLGGKEFKLSTNEYPGTFYPDGYQYISDFKRSTFPTTFFSLGKVKIEKALFMVHGSNTTVIEYTNHSPFAVRLWLNPLFCYRDFHGVEQQRNDHKYMIRYMGHTHSIEACEGAPVLYFRYSHGSFSEGRNWNKQMLYRIDAERGHEYLEDVYSIGYLEHDIPPGGSVFLMFTLEKEMLKRNPAQLKEEELERLNTIVPETVSDKFLRDLIKSGDQFLVRRRSTKSFTIIAGYHWFSDWGRDSMIAIRGLCIATGRKKEAKSVISTFLSYLKGGLIPNRFPDYRGHDPEYNSLDATLWLFIALYEYDLKFKDTLFIKKVFPQLKEIVDHHLKGTLHNIKVLENGLLSGGSKDIQITWMDAKLGNIVFTPRDGCAVEINALWYNALMIFDYFAKRIKNTETHFPGLSDKVKETFNRLFWNDKGYLNDIVSEKGTDASIRPNQIFAVSLPFALLDREKEKKIVANIQDKLLTSFGLRTLDPGNPQFKAKYEGDVMKRDSAYHQGTVWPFLLPEFCRAYLKVHDHSEEAVNNVTKMLLPLKEHFYTRDCIQGISEVFDGMDPLTGKGCVQQAWSVSNLIFLLSNEKIALSDHQHC
jgi:predicted glycogen debranching enzyme